MNSDDCLHITGSGASMPGQTAETISIACHDNEIPAFVEVELERLYGNLFSSPSQFRVYGGLTPDTSTYIARSGDVIISIFLFRHQKRNVQVINEGMKIEGEELRIFSDYIFNRFKSVNFISFHAVEAQIDQFSFPLQRFNCPAEVVLNLPATQHDYLAALGKNPRRNVKRYMEQLIRTFPSFRMDFYEGSTAREDQICKIIDLNRARMECTKKVYVRSAEEVQRIISLTRAVGLVGVAMIEDSICGGTLGYHVGSNYIFKIISHDPQYDNYSIGMLSTYLTISECIARGYKQFNFMDGNNEYKRLLGGVLRNLEQLSIYRSHTRLILNANVAINMIYRRLIYQARLWTQIKLALLKKSKTQGNFNAQTKILFYILDKFRALKDHVSGWMKRN